MTFRRDPPPPPKADPPAVLLIRTLGDLEAMEGGEFITETDAVALICGMVYVDLPALIEVGILAGYLEVDDAGGIGLSAKGQRWYERGRPRGSMLRRD